ncbi:MAG: imidazole glycerol phosphate synthase subunit HisH [Deltaproteobacteria bacterium]|nr:imidazole glycerol phosphate synthase subunit HisH [Deltaproteobacteria bacterium]
MIAIIDYDMGNLRSVQKGFERVGHRSIVTRNPKDISNASHVVLPGVGAFKDCMDNLKNYEVAEPILSAIQSGKPFLGICLGLQLLFSESEEFGNHKGLDVIKGKVKKFQVSSFKFQETETQTTATCNLQPATLKIPHMGWNDIKIKNRPPVLQNIADGSYLYFVHSYYVAPEDKGVIATTTSYGIEFASSVWKDNIFACQFHPEKSQKTGLRILKNFGDMKG